MSTVKSNIHNSAPWYSVLDQRGKIYAMNGIDEPLVVDGPSNTSRKWGMDAPTVAPTVAATGTGVLSTSGTQSYTWYWAWVNANAGTVSNPSPVSTATSSLTNKKVRVSVTATADDSQITHKRIFQNTVGQATTYYKVADISATQNSYVANSSDATISVAAVMEEDHDPPQWFRPYLLFYQGRMHAYGSRIESNGDIDITGAAVTGSGTHFTQALVGQTLHVSGSTITRQISAVSSTTALTLSAAYSGTVSNAAYKIYNGTQKSSWVWSKAGYEEYWPILNELAIFENDNDEPTGLFIVQGQMFATKRRHVYRLLWQGDPLTGGAVYQALDNRGAVNQNCIVVVGATAYILDQRGFYQFDGGSTATPIDQAVMRLVNASDEPVADRINWAQKDKFHGFYDQKRNRVVWFVACGTDTEPRNAFVYDVTMQRWVVESYRQGITANCVMDDDDGNSRNWLGDENGCVWAYSISSRDGAPSTGTLRGSVTGFSGTTVTDSTASFANTGDKLVGVPVYFESGTSAGQWGIVQSNNGTTLTLKAAPSPAPVAGDTYIIGAIEMSLKTRWFSLQSPHLEKNTRSLRVYFETESTEMYMRVRMYNDFSSTPYIDWRCPTRERVDGVETPATANTDGWLTVYLDEDSGYVEVPIGREFARWVRFEFSFIDSDRKPKIIGYDWVAEPQERTTKYRD